MGALTFSWLYLDRLEDPLPTPASYGLTTSSDYTIPGRIKLIRIDKSHERLPKNYKRGRGDLNDLHSDFTHYSFLYLKRFEVRVEMKSCISG